jgi:hypothetical protein
VAVKYRASNALRVIQRTHGCAGVVAKSDHAESFQRHSAKNVPVAATSGRRAAPGGRPALRDAVQELARRRRGTSPSGDGGRSRPGHSSTGNRVSRCRCSRSRAGRRRTLATSLALATRLDATLRRVLAPATMDAVKARGERGAVVSTRAAHSSTPRPGGASRAAWISPVSRRGGAVPSVLEIFRRSRRKIRHVRRTPGGT